MEKEGGKQRVWEHSGNWEDKDTQEKSRWGRQ